MNERERIGKRIAEIRNEKELTQDELANACGVNRVNIAKIENGKYNVSIDILSKITDVLECKIDFTDNKTELKKFVLANKDRDDIVGDLCSDLLRDKEFIWLRSEEEQVERIKSVGYHHYHVQDAVTEFFKEYSGEVVDFEDEDDDFFDVDYED